MVVENRSRTAQSNSLGSMVGSAKGGGMTQPHWPICLGVAFSCSLGTAGGQEMAGPMQKWGVACQVHPKDNRAEFNW